MEITTKLDEAIRDARYLQEECTDEALADLLQVHVTNLEITRESVAQQMPGACIVPSATRAIEARKAAQKGHRLKNAAPDRWTCEQSVAFAREHIGLTWKATAQVATDLVTNIADEDERIAWEQFYRGHLDRVWKKWADELTIIDDRYMVMRRKKSGIGFTQQYRLEVMV